MNAWIKKMWYIYIMEFYSAIKKYKINSFVEKLMKLETIMSVQYQSHVFFQMWNLVKKQAMTVKGEPLGIWKGIRGTEDKKE
jgi:hypothetical protein